MQGIRNFMSKWGWLLLACWGIFLIGIAVLLHFKGVDRYKYYDVKQHRMATMPIYFIYVIGAASILLSLRIRTQK
ncbi:hypothetical protein SAMN05518672_1129 [Chitinophaga sp. CF118]|nr:hypothetical protein SAMN05518672_1129 [Chitinophaga sp. CF118]